MLSKGLRSALIIIVLSFIAGVIGILLGHEYIMPNAGKTVGLHDKIHNELVLNHAQNEKLHRLESEFESQRSEIQSRMKQANAHLSAAMQSTHQMSPEVVAAKNEYIRTLDELQTLTIAHIFSMRGLLDKEQAKEFDRIVQESFRDIAK
ncbi:MAG TPA: periplasmic heavy metal sensor [Gammaproteobacteria bacterium]|nr:periplasmic heavy metal sensor [Gammaproteobacteria bacterium]